jgi:predicted DNA binding protein
MWETELGIRHHGCPVSDVSSDHPGVRFENVRRVEHDDGQAKRLLRFEGGQSAVESFAGDFRAHPLTDSLELVSPDGGSESEAAYYVSEIEFTEETPSIRYLVERAGCFRHRTVAVHAGIEYWTVYTRSKGDVRELVDSVRGFDNDVEVRRNVDIGAMTDGGSARQEPFRSALTDRQIEAFRTALSVGYYDDGSRVTIEDIADRLGVHRSTAGEHVKRAENTLLSEIGDRLFPGTTAGDPVGTPEPPNP